MIIEDIYRGKLELTSSKLVEISEYKFDEIRRTIDPCFVFLNELKHGNRAQLHQSSDDCGGKHRTGHSSLISVSALKHIRIIGCRTFDDRTYRKIFKAIAKAK